MGDRQKNRKTDKQIDIQTDITDREGSQHMILVTRTVFRSVE